MSTAITYQFNLTIDRNATPPTIAVENVTDGGDTTLTLPKGAALPYLLAVDTSAASSAQLAIGLAPGSAATFDPGVTLDGNVLDVSTSTSDRTFTTRDDTKYIVHLVNRSSYYVAEDVRVSVSIEGTATGPLPLSDGTPSLSIIPEEQRVRCIDPGHTKDVVFVAIARGTRAGVYIVDVTVSYRLLYWDGREASATSRHALPVQGPDVCFDIPETESPSRMPRQPSPERNSTMQDPRSQVVAFAPIPPRVRHRVLLPVRQQIPLPGGGSLNVGYRLTKGNHPDPERCACSYGINPDTNSLESYFSTQDTAALEITLQNESHHNLKHVHLTNIRLMSTKDDNAIGQPVEQKLPDGNLFFEIVPADLYYGHLAPHASQLKYLSLITRGVAPGCYVVQMESHYDIEACRVPVDLWLTVNPD